MTNAKFNFVSDLDAERREAITSKYGVQGTSDYKELLNNPEVDALIIATPASTHYRLALASPKRWQTRYGRETSEPSTAGVVTLGAIGGLQKNLTLMVGHTFEFHPAVEKLKEIVQSGELGQLYLIWTRPALIWACTNVT